VDADVLRRMDDEVVGPTTGPMNLATRCSSDESNVKWHGSSNDVLRRKRQAGTMSALPGLKH
jgi:hypothetical protein